MSSRTTSALPTIKGFDYQKKCCLYLIIQEWLDGRTNSLVFLEKNDDIYIQNTFHHCYQVKHHSKPYTMTEYSEDFWKTVFNWITFLEEFANPELTRFVLVTTGIIEKDNVLSFISKSSQINPTYSKLLDIKSESEDLCKYLDKFRNYEEKKNVRNS